jgi:hypothetical protein
MVHWNRFGNPYEAIKAGGKATAEEHLRPTGFLAGSVRGSGVWVGARKLEGELDVEQGRIVRLVGESMSHCGTSQALDKCEGRSSKYEVRLPSDSPFRWRFGCDTLTGVGWFHCSLK